MPHLPNAPYILSPLSTKRIILHIIIALLPLIAIFLAAFGLPAFILITTSVTGCVTFEYLGCRFLFHTPTTTSDLSAIVTGLLLALNLPAGFPLWMLLLGCFFAIIITKMAFGGLGCNLFNPALAALVFLILSFPDETATLPMDSGKASLLPDIGQILKGISCCNLGGASILAVILGLVWLLIKKIISWQIPFYYLATFFILTAIHWLTSGNIRADVITHFLSGSLWLGAVFMATDYTTTPMSIQGKIAFAIGCGILTYIIRFYSIYPESMPFSILIMNALVPLLDKIYAPRAYGTIRR